jgi:hypothetical protein
METKWRTEEPETNRRSKLSKQLVVLTNYGNLNTAVWSGTWDTWYFDGLTASRECVVAWLDGLEYSLGDE